MKKVQLDTVLNLLIAEERDEASKLLHEWFVGKSKAILEELMQEDEGDLDDIDDAKNEIAAEEFYGDVDLDEEGEEEAEGEEEMIDGDDDDFDADSDDFGGDDMGDDMGDDTEASVDDLGDELDSHEAEDGEMYDRIDDLEAQLAQLKSEFAEIVAGDGESDNSDFGTEGDDEGDDFGGEDDGFGAEGDDMDDMEDDAAEGDEVDESEEFDEFDLNEDFDLEKATAPKMKKPEFAGKGGSAPTTTKSPIPQKKVNQRTPGEPVKIKGTEHRGYERETHPTIKDQGLLKNQVKTSKGAYTGVKKGGDKSASLNKEMPKDNGKSPISGANKIK